MKEFDWQIIDTLATVKNITKAEGLLFMSQSALTKRLKQIETDLNTVIFIRSQKGLELTEAGEYVAKAAHDILTRTNELRDTIARANDSDTGELRIGSPNSYTRFYLPEFMSRYSTLHPDIQLNITTALSSEILNMIDERVLQLGFVRGDLGDTTMKYHTISEDQVHLVSKERIDINDLARLPQIDYTKEHTVIKATRKWWEERFDTAPIIRMKVNHGDICREMIAHGLGYGIFSDIKFIENYPDFYVEPLFYKDGTPLTRKTWIVYHPDEIHKRAVKDFIDFTMEYHGKK